VDATEEGVTVWNPKTGTNQDYSWEKFYSYTEIHDFPDNGGEIIFHDAAVWYYAPPQYYPDPPGSI